MRVPRFAEVLIVALLLALYAVTPARAGGLDVLEKGRLVRLLDELRITTGGVYAGVDLTNGAAIGGGTLDAEEILDVTGDATRKSVNIVAGTNGSVTLAYPSDGEINVGANGIVLQHVDGIRIGEGALAAAEMLDVTGDGARKDVSVTGGASADAAVQAGGLFFTAGNNTDNGAAEASGGEIHFSSGSAQSDDGFGGQVSFTGGDGSGTGNGGHIAFNAGDVSDALAGSEAGDIDFVAGSNFGAGRGGTISFEPGPSISGDPGDLNFNPGDGRIQIEEQATPATPEAGYVGLYAKSSDGLLYSKDDAGTESLVSASRWFTVTFTGSWSTNTTYVGKARWVGPGIMECQLVLEIAGQPTDAVLTINPPTGYTLDTSGFVFSSGASSSTVTEAPMIGVSHAFDDGVARYAPGVVMVSSSASTSVIPLLTSLPSGTVTQAGTTISRTSPHAWGAGDRVFLRFTISVTPS